MQVAGSDLEVRSALLSLTSPWNLTGMPALSVPAGHVEDLPAAIQLVAAADECPMMPLEAADDDLDIHGDPARIWAPWCPVRWAIGSSQVTTTRERRPRST